MYQYLQIAHIETVSKNTFGNSRMKFSTREIYFTDLSKTDNVRCLIVSRRQRRTAELAPCMESAEVD